MDSSAHLFVALLRNRLRSRYSVIVAWGLLQEPGYEFFPCCIVILLGHDFAMVRVFVVQPGIDYGKYRAPAIMRGRHHDAGLIFKHDLGGGLYRNSARIFHVECMRVVKDRATAATYRNVTGRKLITDDMAQEYIVEVDAETVGDQIKVRNVRIGRIIFHQDENASLFYPFGDLLRVLRLHVMRMRILCGIIRGDDDVKLGAFEPVRRRSLIQRIEGCTVACEDVSKDGEAAIAIVIPFVMEVFFLSCRIRSPLTVEPCVDHHRLAACSTRGWSQFHLRARQQKGAYSLWIVTDDWRAYIVGIRSIVIGRAAKPDASHRAGHGYRSAIIGLDEMAQNSLPGARRVLGKVLR